MLKNYLVVTLRSLLKNKLQSTIKIAGLALGIGTCLVMYVIITYELSFDTFQDGRERIYRVYSEFSGVMEGVNQGVPGPLPASLEEEFTGIEVVAPFLTYSAKVKVREGSELKNFETQEKIILAKASYFKVFPMYTWVAGSPEVLEKPFTVVITESKARLYFGTSEPNGVLGKEIIYSDSLSVTVVGIVQDIKRNTDFNFTDFISHGTLTQSWLKDSYDLTDWGSTTSSSQCFIRLAKGTEAAKIESQLPLLKKHYEERDKVGSWKVDFRLQPLGDLHFNSKLGIFDHARSAANLTTLKIIGVVAMLLLIIAAINFINLETAEAIKRSKEVGVRKVLGSSRMNLVLHFLGDSFLLTAVAVILSVPLCYGAILYFKEFLPPDISFPISDLSTYVFLGGTLAIVGFLSGVYPALVLSSFQPAKALKIQNYGSDSNTAMLRKGLTVFQFAISQVLIVGTIVIMWQIDYIVNKDLGFSKDSIVTFAAPWRNVSKLEALKNELGRIPGISAMCLQNSAPITSGYNTSVIKYKTESGEQADNVHQKNGDTTYLGFYNLKLMAGRNVQASDSALELVINDTYRKKLGFATPHDALDAVVIKSKKNYTIVGVMADFHMQSLHHAIEPMSFSFDSRSSGFAIRLATKGKSGDDVQAVLDQLTAEWNKIYSDRKLSYAFLDDNISKLYETERRTSKLAGTATGMAIFISCLGLFGLASFTAVQRTKEIGIRKVLGASVRSIVMLLSGEFLVLVAIAFLIATPLSYFAADKWLAGFAYRVGISAWVFIAAGLLSVMIAFLTVSYRAIKAGVANPVDSLRYE